MMLTRITMKTLLFTLIAALSLTTASAAGDGQTDGAHLAFDSDLCGTCKRRLFGILRNEFPKSWQGWERIKQKDGIGGESGSAGG